MSDSSHEEAIETFQSITGADAQTAEHVLEAHAWDLTRGINFFMEQGGSITAQPYSSRENDAGREIANGDQPTGQEAMLFKDSAAPPGAPGSAPQSHEDDDDEDFVPHGRRVPFQMLQAERRRREQATGRNQNDSEAVDLSSTSSSDKDEQDDDLEVIEPSSQRTPQTRASTRAELNSHRIDDDVDDDEAADGSHLPALRGQALPRGLGNGLGSGFPAFMPGPYASNGLPRASAEFDSNMIPDGIDVEEAKMLEAAMMGVPYRGRMPDFDAQAQRPAMPEDPNVIQQRLLREEQDQAYQDSLLADIEKKSAAEAVERAEEEQRLQVVREKEAAEQSQRDYEQDIEFKMLNLPEEPVPGTPEAITVMIRTPQGARFGRRFMTDDSVRSLFWFADVNAAPDFKPGTYNLVTQFPRKVLNTDLEGTLVEAGLSQKQEALFLEAL